MNIWLEQLRQDVRFGLRTIRNSPGFTAVVVITLALGIAANALVFGVLNALVLRPLDLPRSESLYGIQRVSDSGGRMSYPQYLETRDRNRSFEDLLAYGILQAGFDTGADPTRSWICEASGNYFE